MPGLLFGVARTRVVGGPIDEGRPFVQQCGIVAKCGDRGERHSHRTADAVLALVPEIAERGARDMRAWALARPSERMRFAPEYQRHELVVGRMELDEIDAVAEAVVRSQLRQMPVGLAREVLHPLATNQAADPLQLIRRPAGAKYLDRFDERPVPGIEVVVLERAGWFITSWVANPTSESAVWHARRHLFPFLAWSGKLPQSTLSREVQDCEFRLSSRIMRNPIASNGGHLATI